MHVAKIVQSHFKIKLSFEQKKDFFNFMTFYWCNVKALGVYLLDIDFKELNPEERKKIVCYAFCMWKSLQYNLE